MADNRSFVQVGKTSMVADLPAAPPLEVDEVSFSYGDQPALIQVSFRLEPASFTALLGANGAGKTTLVSLITRLIKTREGDLRIAGRSLRDAGSAALVDLGVVFQEQTLDLDLTAEQNLRYFAGLRGLSGRQMKERIDLVLEQLAIVDQRAKKVRHLSGGQRRRLEIARSLLHEPTLLILDEPTVGLDIPSRRALVQEVHDLTQKAGVTVLWATHLTDEVRSGDRLVLLHLGRIVAQGSVEEVMSEAGKRTLDDTFNVLTQAKPGP
jgi:ABC-2 type transport system ATP-binding protein